MKYKYITSLVVILFLLSVSITSIIRPDYNVSEQEGRKLQQIPTKDMFKESGYINGLLNGEVFKTWDNYFGDQIVGRGKIVSIYTKIQKLLGKRYINKVYLTDDNDYIEDSKYDKYDDKYIKNRAENFNILADRFSYSKVYTVNIPNKNYAYESKIPIKDYKAEQSIYIPKIFKYINNNINKIDLTNKMKENPNYYYKTDHHMNMDGAYEVYKEIISNISKDFPDVKSPKDKSEYYIKNYKNSFIGSQGRKVLSILDKKDDIQVYYDKSFVDYKAYNENGQANLYYEGYIKGESLSTDYAVYLGGNNGLYKLYNNQSENNIKIAIIGDSIDNPLIPLMAPHFKELYSYDLRYYEGNILDDIENINPDIIMCIGLSNNFINETDVFKWR